MNSRRADLPPREIVMEMISGYWVSAAIHAVAKLGVCDAIGDGEKSAEALAVDTGAHAPSLLRVLRALAGAGLFKETSPGKFRLGPLGGFLRSGGEDSLRGLALFQGHTVHQKAWTGFLDAVRTGRDAFSTVHGKPVFELMPDEPDYAGAFDEAMDELTRNAAPAIRDAYDFSGLGTIVDIGGGRGALLSAILEKHAELRGLVLEAPGPAAKVRLRDRMSVATGSFFDPLPEAGAYLAKHILHDWSDAKCLEILARMREGLKPAGRILVVESVLPEGGAPHPARWLDLEMLSMCPGGKERTRSEFESLFREAGFSLTRVVETEAGVSIIEGLPA